MRLILLSLSLVFIGCAESEPGIQVDMPQYETAPAAIIMQFKDNLDGCTPESIAVQVDGQDYDMIDLATDPEYMLAIQQTGDAMDVYFDVSTLQCGSRQVPGTVCHLSGRSF